MDNATPAGAMRAFVVTAPGRAAVRTVPVPVPGPGEVLVAVQRCGVCGTDAEFFSGEMSYLHTGQAEYPMRLGHEWAGVVSSLGPAVDPGWLGRRVTGDTMLGCGRCARCAGGRQHLCADRYEIGIRRGWPGALAEYLPVPVRFLHPLPSTVDATAGALVEPGGNALRAVRAAAVGPGERLLVLGPGTIGLLCALLAAAEGVEVHLLGRDEPSLAFGRSLGFASSWTAGSLPPVPFDAVIDASNAPALPARAVELVEPGRRVVFIGIAGEPSPVDTRELVFKDVTAVGVLSGSAGLSGVIDRFAAGVVDPRPLVAATVGLAEVPAVLAGERRPEWGAAPKIQVDPRR
jgi:threonine dehydrogenase-like Zn-dependent dehydrogenase